MNRGYVKIFRCIEDNFLWRTKEPYCKRAAWIDLIIQMNHTDNDFNLGNQRMTVRRGQRWTSVGNLATRWKWSERKVRSFISLLEREGMVYKESTNRGMMLTVLNYSKYQDFEGKRVKLKAEQKAELTTGLKAEQKTSKSTSTVLPTALPTDSATGRQTIMNKNDIKNDINNEIKNVKKPSGHSNFFVEE